MLRRDFGRLFFVVLLLSSGRLDAAEPIESASAGSATAEAREEVRAIWVTRWDFLTRGDVETIVSNCAKLGLNRIYFQVRGRADAFYRSSLEPWAEELGGDPGFDPLETAITAARRHGVELHAWINVLAGWKGKTPPRDRRHIFHQHPEWFLIDRAGKRYLLDEHYTMLNPCLTAVRKHLAAVVREIARYPVDGVHLDYIRFVFPPKVDRAEIPWDPGTIQVFTKEAGAGPAARPDDWNRFRERAINTIVYELSQAVREVRPECRLSAAVVKELERGRKLYFQASPVWLRESWIHEVLPMNYDLDDASFSRSARGDLELSGHRAISGLGAHLYRSGRDLERQIAISRQIGAPGYCLFAYASFHETASHASETGESANRIRRELREALLRMNGPRRLGELGVR